LEEGGYLRGDFVALFIAIVLFEIIESYE